MWLVLHVLWIVFYFLYPSLSDQELSFPDGVELAIYTASAKRLFANGMCWDWWIDHAWDRVSKVFVNSIILVTMHISTSISI